MSQIEVMTTSSRLQPASRQDRREVLHHLLGLLDDAALDHVALRRVDAQLAGDEDHLAGDDRLQVGRPLERRRGALGSHCTLAHRYPSTRSMLAPSARRRSSIRS